MDSAFLDSTVLVSAFITPFETGVAFTVLGFAFEGRYDALVSEYVLAELSATLLRPRRQRKLGYTDEDVAKYCDVLRARLRLVPDVTARSIVRDLNDDAILAAALSAGPTYLVTRDKDLLVLGKGYGVDIVTPEAFLAILRARG